MTEWKRNAKGEEYLLCAPNAHGVHELRLFKTTPTKDGDVILSASAWVSRRIDNGKWNVDAGNVPIELCIADVVAWGERAMRHHSGAESVHVVSEPIEEKDWDYFSTHCVHDVRDPG